MSSLNVALMSRRRGGLQAFEETPLPECVTPQTLSAHPHYAVTKWASEQLIQSLYTRAAGAWRVSVSRPALISWSAATGVANDSDWLPRVLASCLQMRSAIGPDESGVPEWVAETVTSARGVELVPVDFVARSVARLGRLTETASLPSPTRPGAEGQVPTFHVSNLAPGEQGLVTGQRLMDLLVAADLRVSSGNRAGPLWPIDQLPRTRWLLEAELEATPALPITDQLKNMQPSFARTQTRRFAAALGPERCPPVDLELVETYVRRQREIPAKS